MTVTLGSGGCCGRSIWNRRSSVEISMIALLQAIARHHLRVQPRYLQWRRRPIEDVEEESPRFCRGSNRFNFALVLTSSRIWIRRHREPVADGAKTLLNSVGSSHRVGVRRSAGVTPRLATSTRLRREKSADLNSRSFALYASLVYGHAGFPQLKIFWRGITSSFLLNAGMVAAKRTPFVGIALG